jgi:hypothetical protein
MNAIAAHKDELKKLLEDLSGGIAASEIPFVALVDAYITRLDANCPDISVRVNPPPAEINRRTNMEPTLISRCVQQASAGYSPATDARRTFQAFTALPEQRPLSDVG